MRISQRFLYIAIGSIFAFAMRSATSLQAQQATDDPYVRYTTPGQCEQAGLRLSRLYWRDKRQDTVMYAPATDSFPASAIEGIRACISRFTVEGVAERELLDLAQAYLMLKQDDRAEAAIARLLASPSQKNPIRRGWTLLQIAQSLQGAKPARLDAAKKYIAQLDALGDTVSAWRLFAHYGVSDYAMSVNDTAMAQAEARSALAASATMTHADRQDFVIQILNAYVALTESTAHSENSGEHSLAVFDSAWRDILRLRPEGSRELAGLRQQWEGRRAPYTLFGKVASPLLADRWFSAVPSMDGMGQTPQYPEPGKVSLIVFVNANCGARCFPMYSTIRRLQQEFGERGVDVILTSQVSGWFRNKLAEADEESRLISQYYQDFLELPLTVGVEFREMQKRATDGRVMRPPTENMRNYLKGRSVVIVRKDGTIGVSSDLGPDREVVWNAALQEALSR